MTVVNNLKAICASCGFLQKDLVSATVAVLKPSAEWNVINAYHPPNSCLRLFQVLCKIKKLI